MRVIASFPGSWCLQGFVCALQASLADMRFDFKHDCAPPPILQGLLHHVRGQGRQPRRATPPPRSSGCVDTGGLRGATPCSRAGEVAMRRYPSSKVKSSGCALRSSHEEITHVQGKRNPSKTVDVARGHQRADTLKPYS